MPASQKFNSRMFLKHALPDMNMYLYLFGLRCRRSVYYEQVQMQTAQIV